MRTGRDLHNSDNHDYRACYVPARMARLYNVWDGLIYLSGGEGFGLPAWEAICAGLPVVFTNYASHAEFLTEANAGLPVGGILQPESGSGIWRMIADESQAIEAIRKLYADRELGKTLGSNGRAFTEQFSQRIQVERWHHIFQRLIRRLQ